MINKAKPVEYASAGLFNDPDFNAILKMSGVKSIVANRKDRKGNMIHKGGKSHHISFRDDFYVEVIKAKPLN